VLLACWSPKGGVGTTVVATALALGLVRADPAGPGVLLADLAGDVPAALGLAGAPVGSDADGPGLTHWLAAAPDVPADALGRIEVPVAPGLALLRRGAGPFVSGAGEGGALLAAVLDGDPRRVVVDCGRIDVDAGEAGDAAVGMAVAGAAERSLLVLRPCFLAVRRAAAAPVRATGVVLVDEPGRALGAADLSEALGLPVVARVRVTEQIARTVDAGLLTARLPRSLVEDLRGAA
jgi:hypothetical protein